MATCPPANLGPIFSAGVDLLGQRPANLGPIFSDLLGLGPIFSANDVTIVNSGREALERAEDEPFDVIFCDVMMPEVSGMEVHDTLQERQPELASRMIFVTGGAFSESSCAFLDETDRPWLQKPVNAVELRERVDEVLEAEGPFTGC